MTRCDNAARRVRLVFSPYAPKLNRHHASSMPIEKQMCSVLKMFVPTCRRANVTVNLPRSGCVPSRESFLYSATRGINKQIASPDYMMKYTDRRLISSFFLRFGQKFTRVRKNHNYSDSIGELFNQKVNESITKDIYTGETANFFMIFLCVARFLWLRAALTLLITTHPP